MNEPVQLAEQLGKAIADSPQARALGEARKALNAHADVVQALKDYQVQAQKIDQLEAEHKPVEVEDKHKLDELQAKLVASDIFKKFTAAQVDYVDLMRKVNQILRKYLASVEQD